MTNGVPMVEEIERTEHERGLLPLLDGIRVLVVDDDPEARAAIVVVLEECNVEVIAVGSAAEGLAALRRHRPDVLVSDIAMPGVDGRRFIRRVRALDRAHGGGTPAAALTAYASDADRMHALLAGYQVFLEKPFDPPELIALIAELARAI